MTRSILDLHSHAERGNKKIISGGPGTGKTFTDVNILALLLEQNPQLSIVLAAPTGKAVAPLPVKMKGGLEALAGESCLYSPAKASSPVERRFTALTVKMKATWPLTTPSIFNTAMGW